MGEKSGWKNKKRKSSFKLDGVIREGMKDKNVFRATGADYIKDYNYKNIQLPSLEPDNDEVTSGRLHTVEGLSGSMNETNLSTDPGPGPGPGPGPADSTEVEIPEWEMPDSAFIAHVPERLTDHPGIWAFSRLLNRMIDQLNWFLKYLYGAGTAANQEQPDALAVLWAFILTVIMFFVQIIFLIPNMISYATEFLGICFAVILFELFAKSEDKEKYRQVINAAIEGVNGIVGTIVAFLVTLNLWYAIAVRQSDTDIVSMVEGIFSKTLFGFFRHGLAGAFMLNHLFGRMKLGLSMQDPPKESSGGAAGLMDPTKLASLASGNPMDMLKMATGGKTMGQMASDALAKKYEKLINAISGNATIWFMVLFLIIFSSFMGGAFTKLMDSQNTIKSAMGDGGGSPVWYIIIIFCMIASAASFLAAVPGKFNVLSPLLSLFHILMLLIATLVTFQLGAIVSIMIMFYYMFLVIPVEEFGKWRMAVDAIFVSFKTKPQMPEDTPIWKKIVMNYGVVIVFILAIMGSFIRMMVDVNKAMPPNPSLTGGMVGITMFVFGLMAYFIYKYVFPENLKELIGMFQGMTSTESSSSSSSTSTPAKSSDAYNKLK